jgi:pimeloyl-ACP methyl ester carboxylesterase
VSRSSELEAGRTVADPPKQLAALFRPSVQPYLISSFQVDPAAELAKLTVPVLVVAGATDIQVPPAEAKLLAAANPRAKAVVIADMNHVLKEQKSTNRFDQLLTYMNRDQPLHPALIPTLADFLSAALGK